MWNEKSKGWPFLPAKALGVLSANNHGPGNARLFMLASVLGSAWLLLAGIGSALASPIYINSISDLQNIQSDLSGDYVLASDIDASGYAFAPIGETSGAFSSDTYNDPYNLPSSSSGAFTGTLNGQGHTIYGLTINSTAPVVGLFDRIGSAASISNLNLQDVSISETSTTKTQLIGSLAGISDGAISNVHVSGAETISATPTSDGPLVPGFIVSGGLVGLTTPTSTILDSSSAVNISASGSAANLPESFEQEMVGGLVGKNGGTVSGSSSSGAVNAESVTTYAGAIGGGLIGINDGPGDNGSATVAESFSTGSVSIVNGIGGGFVGDNYGIAQRSYATGSVLVDAGVVGGAAEAGGFAGGNSGEISQSYAHGDALATSPIGGYSQAGGFVGAEVTIDHPLLDEVYATGNVQGSNYPGGLVGGNDPNLSVFCSDINCSVTNSYWDTQTTGRSTSLYGGVGLTTAQLQSGTLPAGFDSSIWNASPGQYPTLKFQGNEPSVPALSCGEILAGSVSAPNLLFNGTSIIASFTPNGGVSLTEAAQKCGLVGFDWKQTITSIPDPIPNNTKGCLEDVVCVLQYPLTSPLTPPFNDPPEGGWPYCFNTWCGSSFPFYYDAVKLDSSCAQFDGSQCVLPVLSGNSLNFFDSPNDFCLPNADGTPSQQYQDSILNREICDFKVADVGSVETFETELFGVLPGFVPGEDCLTATPATCVDLGLGFSWTDDFNGSTGNIAVSMSNTAVDPQTGAGGIVVTELRNISPYEAPEPPTILLITPLLLFWAQMAPRRRNRFRFARLSRMG